METKQFDYYELTRNIFISEIAVVIMTLVTMFLPKSILYAVFMVMKIVSLSALSISLYLILYAKKRQKVLIDEMVRDIEARAFSFAQLVSLAALLVFLLINFVVQINIQFTSDIAILICYSFLALKDGYYIFSEHEGHEDASAYDED